MKQLKLMPQIRGKMRLQQMGLRTEEAYTILDRTTMIYTHMLNKGPLGVTSPMAGMFGPKKQE